MFLICFATRGQHCDRKSEVFHQACATRVHMRGSHAYIYTGISIYIVVFTDNVSIAVKTEAKSAYVYCALRADQVERARVRRGDNHRRYDAKLKLK